MRIKLRRYSYLLGLCLCGCMTTRREASDPKPAPPPTQMEQVTGIGGVFIKARDPKAMAAWYRDHLGIQTRGGYADFAWREKDHPEQMGRTVWSLFPTNTPYFAASPAPFMINYRVANLDRMIDQLRRSGIKVEKVEEYDYGRFTWITDPENNRIELWEPREKK